MEENNISRLSSFKVSANGTDKRFVKLRNIKATENNKNYDT